MEQNMRVDEKDFKLLALSIITESFYCLEKYEKAIEYGKKAIEYRKGFLKVSLYQKSLAAPRILPKNERTNSSFFTKRRFAS